MADPVPPASDSGPARDALNHKWLNEGVLEKGYRIFVETASPHGGSASPLLAIIYHYVFDLWVQAWCTMCGHSDVIVALYANNIMVGFEFTDESEWFWSELKNEWRSQLELLRRRHTNRVRTPHGKEPKSVLVAEGVVQTTKANEAIERR